MSAESKKRLAVAIVDFLNKSLKDGTLAADDADSVEIATNCIAECFKVDPTDPAVLADAVGPGQDLLQIYGVYERLRKGSSALRGASAATGSSTAAPKPASPKPAAEGISPEQKKEAEGLKSQGNAAMQQKDYPTAIKSYTSALAIHPQNAIYLSNRAAAYSASNQQEAAMADAQAAVDIDPSFAKAWSRLGFAKYQLGDAEGAMNAYSKGIEAEGNGGSDAMKKGFETAKKAVESGDMPRSESPAAAAGAGNPFGGAGAGGMPDLSGLASMLGGGGRGGGGMPDFASLMNNPMFSNFANQMMSNPDMMNNLMSNPAIRRAAEGLTGGGQGGQGGGMPDLSSLMNDPNIADMARNLMGGGAGRGRGRGDPPPPGYA